MAISNNNDESVAWGLQSKIVAGMGAVILMALSAIGVLSTMGFSNMQVQMAKGDEAIYKKIADDNMDVKARLGEICQQNVKTNEILMRHTEEIAVLRTNQQARLYKERLADKDAK